MAGCREEVAFKKEATSRMAEIDYTYKKNIILIAYLLLEFFPMGTQPTPPAPAPQPAPLPPEVYAVFCGGIEQATAQKIVNALTGAMARKAQHVHVLFQTAGGYVGDGVFLYNFFRTVPIELTLYNGGQISSAGVIAFLGARHRKTSPNATFMVHRSTNTAQFATSTKLKHIAKSLVLDDQRCEAILRSHVTLPAELWAEIEHRDLYLSGTEAIGFNLADEIGEFSPPAGTQVYNLMAG
jgi:ATP-dependent protease ClpP protease subunit